MEVFKSLPEGTLAEIIEGELYMSSSGNTNHQRISRKITAAFEKFLDNNPTKGEFFVAAYDVYLDETSNAVQPDLVFVLQENSSIIKEDCIHGVPDLLVEILSPGNKKHDLETKKVVYEKFGVKEYWIIDPKTKQSTGYLLQNGTYSPLETDFGKLKSVLLNHEFTF